MAITPTDFEKIWSTNASTPAYTFDDADYLEGWDFVGNLPPTRAQWNAIQKRTDEKMKYVFDNFGAPLIAPTVADMTLQNRVYVYTGSEVGYTAGDWYYYDEGTSTWVDGGVYNAVAIVTDTTLTQAGVPADAKATGDALSLKADISSVPIIDPTLTISGAAADAKVTGNLFDVMLQRKDDASLFSVGAIASATGIDTPDSTRMRTPILQTDIVGFKVGTNYDYAIFGFQSDGTYVGRWQGTTWGTGAKWFSSDGTNILFNQINEDYIYRLQFRRTDEATIDLSVDAQQVEFIYYTDPTLSKPHKPANSKATGDAIALISSDTYNIVKDVMYGRYICNTSTGVISLTTSARYFGISDKIPCLGSTIYVAQPFNLTVSSTTTYYFFAFYDVDGVFVSSKTESTTKDCICIETPSTARYMHIYLGATSNNTITYDSTSRIQIQSGCVPCIYAEPRIANDTIARHGQYINISVVENSGYITPTGTIAESDPDKNSKYTDKIDVSCYDEVSVGLSYTEVRALWLFCATYDKAGNFIERIELYNGSSRMASGSRIKFNNDVQYVSFTYRKFSDGVFTVLALPSIPSIIDVVTKDVDYEGKIEEAKFLAESTFFKEFTHRYKPLCDHLFVNTHGNNTVIPHESIYHVRLSRRMGFNIIEANVASTSDGVFIVNHLTDGAFGTYFYHVDGVTDISAIKVADVTWAWIVENVRYYSTIPKYRTRPCTLQEFLTECRQQNILPFVTSRNADVVAIVEQYMGKDNYIAYNGTREISPTALISQYGSFASKEAIIEYCERFGRPFMLSLGNPGSFTDEELMDIVDELHKRGYWIATSYNDGNWYKYSAMGFDKLGSITSINRIAEGNICNYDTIFNWTDFTYTNATLTDGVLTYTADGTLSPNVDNTVLSVGGVDFEIDFVGSITVPKVGERASKTYTSDGSYPVFFASALINSSPSFTITVASGTVIKDVKFKATKF